MQFNSKAFRGAVTALALLAALPAGAQCSRPIRAPVAALGLSVIVEEGRIGGVYPDLLRSAGGGCSFEFSVVPRARVEALFEAGQIDMLVPASRSARRDEFGVFVPLIQSRATLLSLQSERAPIGSLAELLAEKGLRVALVRGFDFGGEYQRMVEELRKQGRLLLDRDPVSVARMLEAGMADVTVMAPSILSGSMMTDTRIRHLLGRLRVEPLEEFPWTEAGVYLSRSALSEADRNALTVLFDRMSRSGAPWRAFQQYYPASSLEGSIRPRRSGSADPAQ